MTVLSTKIFGFSLLVGCASQATTAPDTCPRNGVVPPDLRDVERAGEGLVATTFGNSPDFTAAWPRAVQVQAVLKQVWQRTKTACTELPPDAVAQIDKAIADLDGAIAAKDQAKAAQAANAVGLGVVPLFDWFHPDAPKEIVRMDAVYRQVGIDARAGQWQAVAADLATLDADWQTSQAAVAKRVPTCHRVGGTATIAEEIANSLAHLKSVVPAHDATATLAESEAGALQIDTLELLFDCPPDGISPDIGLGSACSASKPCTDGLVCNMDGGTGRCSPDGKVNTIGGPCTTTTDCGKDSRSACLTEAGDNYPGGYCGMEPCDDIQLCPTGATCVAIGGETPGCLKSCTEDKDCRSGYVCQLFSTLPPAGFGPTAKACAFACTRDSDCQPTACGKDCKGKLTCNVATGKCQP